VYNLLISCVEDTIFTWTFSLMLSCHAYHINLKEEIESSSSRHKTRFLNKNKFLNKFQSVVIFQLFLFLLVKHQMGLKFTTSPSIPLLWL